MGKWKAFVARKSAILGRLFRAPQSTIFALWPLFVCRVKWYITGTGTLFYAQTNALLINANNASKKLRESRLMPYVRVSRNL